MKDSITIEWHISDVRDVREDITDEQAREVLQYIERNHDACVGVNWDVIEDAIESLYPEEDIIHRPSF